MLNPRRLCAMLPIVFLPACERPQAIPGGAPADTTSVAAADTAAAARTVGAPSPPGGYAVENLPAEGGMLAVIEYLSPQTVEELAEYYDDEIDSTGRFVVGDDESRRVLYTLSGRSTVNDGVTTAGVDEIRGARTEPIVVVEPWSMDADAPLLRHLREAGQESQARRLEETRSRTTIVYGQAQ